MTIDEMIEILQAQKRAEFLQYREILGSKHVTENGADRYDILYSDWLIFDGIWNFQSREYRVKPRNLVHKWKWAARDNYDGSLFITDSYHKHGRDHAYGTAYEFLQKIDSTKKEFEE